MSSDRIFPDISELDRAGARVTLRKCASATDPAPVQYVTIFNPPQQAPKTDHNGPEDPQTPTDTPEA